MTLGRYTALRLQVDPLDPPPRRYLRWVLFVTAVGLAIVGGLLLIAYAIVSDATSLGGTCGSASNATACGSPVFEYVFFVPGILLLAVGLILGAIGLVKMVR